MCLYESCTQFLRMIQKENLLLFGIHVLSETEKVSTYCVLETCRHSFHGHQDVDFESEDEVYQTRL